MNPVLSFESMSDFILSQVPRHQRPSFSTFNIRRTYRLKVILTVECAQKTFKREFAPWEDFVLLAADFVPEVDERTVASASTAVDEFEAAPVYDEKPPPGYEDG